MEFTILSSSGELVIEIINAIISIFVIIWAIFLTKQMKGGALAKTWTWITLGAIFFGALEIYGLLKGLDLLIVHGLSDTLELLAIGSFAIAFYKAAKALR